MFKFQTVVAKEEFPAVFNSGLSERRIEGIGSIVDKCVERCRGGVIPGIHRAAFLNPDQGNDIVKQGSGPACATARMC
jgi:hypothetical protein